MPGVPSDHGVSNCLFFCQYLCKPSHKFLANILNSMKMDCRVERKIVVNDKLVTVNSMKLRLELE